MSIKRNGPLDHMKPRDMERIALCFVMHQLRETGIGEGSIRNKILAAAGELGLPRDDVEFFVDSISQDFIGEVMTNNFDKELAS